MGAKRLEEKEQTWRTLLKNHPELIETQKAPLSAGIASIASELASIEQRPCVFFNLASLLPDSKSVRSDIFQPVVALALVGRVIGIMGPAETDLVRFMEALSRLDTNSLIQQVTVREFNEKITTDVPAPSFDQSSQNAILGHLLVRNQKSAILILSTQFIDTVPASHSFRLLSHIHSISATAELTVLINLHTPNTRRVLRSLTDDILIFDASGVAYFGPTNRFEEYLALVGFQVPRDADATDFIFALMNKHARMDPTRVATDTSPTIRFRYSPIADYVREIVERYIPSDPSAPPVTERRKSFFGPKRSARKSDVEDAMLRLAAIAEAEAEAERQRIAEANAELMWKRLAEEPGI
eukprot:c3287_g1_i1.p1 GENE.c3287_g1_i1~~c3287_g1_i1.p1  ORF type:complete len:404 (+),score=122.29 c3287_g1_i1:152-1213(+)